MSACAWVTLATNDSYSLGALVLAHSLRTVGTAHQLAVMVTPGVTPTMREHLRSVFDLVHDVNVLDSNDASNLALLARPELGITFTKLHCWSLTQYTKCVFMDADTLVLQACDELFDREELSAAPDVGWPDCFNSGVFVFRPSADTFKNLIDFALSRGSFDGGDQGLLNLYFSNWATQDSSRRLPFIYNMCSTAVYSYLPAFKQFGNDAKIVHFIGQLKPWLLELDTQSGLITASPGYEHLQPILQQWWSIFLADVLPKLQPDMGGMAGALAQLSIGSPRSEQQIALEQHWRRQAWEQGNADYLGKDAFDKIWQKIQSTLQGVQPPAAGDAPPAPPPVGDTRPPPPAPVAVEPPSSVPTEPIAQQVAAAPASVVPEPAPASIAPTSPPPGDQKTPAQPPPSASATPKSEPLDANRPTALPVSQSAPASAQPTVTPFKLADLSLSSTALSTPVGPPSSPPAPTATTASLSSPPPHATKGPSSPPISPISPIKSSTSSPPTLKSPPVFPTAEAPISPPLPPTPKSPPSPPMFPTAKAPRSPPQSPTVKVPASPPCSPSTNIPTSHPLSSTATAPTSTPLSPTAKTPTSPPLSPTGKSPISPPLSPTAKTPTSPPLSPTAKTPTSPPLSPTARSPISPPLSPTAKTPTSPPLFPTAKSPTSPPLFPTAKTPTSPPISPTAKTPTSPPLSPTGKSPPSPSFPTTKRPTSPPLSPIAKTPTTPPLSPTTKTPTSPPIDASVSPQQILPLKPLPPPAVASSAPPIPLVAQPIPHTPIVTGATPPTSPPIGPLSRSPEALDVGSMTPPETPPIGSGGNLQATADNQVSKKSRHCCIL